MPKNESIADMKPATYTKERDKRGREWMVRVEWTELTGRMEPTSLLVIAPEHRQALNAETIKQLALGTILSEHRKRMVHQLEQAAAKERPQMTRSEAAQMKAAWKRKAAQYGASRGVAMTPEGLEAVATVYRQAYEEGRPVQKAVADAFGIAVSTAANRIMLARRAGHDLPNPRETR